MKPGYKIAIGAAALVLGTALIATHPGADKEARDEAIAARARLTAVTPAARHDVDYAQIDARLKRLMERPTMVGLAVGIVENGHITFLKGYGETLAGSKDPVTPETVFRWASVSKGVAATMVTKLAEQGKVDLSAPIAAYDTSLRLPSSAEQRATVGDLLSHRLGIYHNAYDERLEAGEDAAVIRSDIGGLSLVCQPGTCWNYENVAFDASSEIVRNETGRPYQTVVERRLFDPLGMTSASVTMDGLTNSKSWAHPHNAGRREVELTDSYYRVPAAGGVNSDIKDLAVWMLAQMGEMPGVVSPNVLETIHARVVKTPGERSRLRKFLERLKTAWYGYGWRSYDYAGHRIVGHRGGVNGYRSLILFDPAKKSGVVALWNSNTSQPGGLEFEVMDMVYHLPFRDWLQIDHGKTAVAAEEEASDNGGSGSPGS
ncbi:MAG TPA: serine hydrolase domain-containing protein [Sphingomicrobium sp.]|nr:serine hydrolase domain-containing protein [Sphingomicrobium sp.]